MTKVLCSPVLNVIKLLLFKYPLYLSRVKCKPAASLSKLSVILKTISVTICCLLFGLLMQEIFSKYLKRTTTTGMRYFTLLPGLQSTPSKAGNLLILQKSNKDCGVQDPSQIFSCLSHSKFLQSKWTKRH